MGHVLIQSADDLFAFMALTLTGEAQWEDVDVDRLCVTIPLRVEGSRRDGRVDQYSARLIQDLQRHAVKAFKAYGNIPTGGRKTELRTAVSNGSDLLKIDPTELIKEAIRKMTGSQCTASICLFLLLGTAYLSFCEYDDNKLEAMRLQASNQDAQHQREHVATMTEQAHQADIAVVEALRDFATNLSEEFSATGGDAQKPIRRFAKSLKKNDLISLYDTERINKKETIERIGILPVDNTLFHVHADGDYDITGIDLRGEAQGLRIAQGEEKTFAILERLDEPLKLEILRVVKESMETKRSSSMHLQIDIYFKASGIEYGSIIGVGAPREGHRNYQLDDIPNEIAPSKWLRSGSSD